jgi:DNA-binding CsgD family transcriptional regulator
VESESADGSFVVRPLVVAGTPLDLAVTVSCVLLLCVIFAIEVLTPSAVVGAFAVLPLAAGVWLVSSRFAALILAVTGLLFIAAAVIEAGNRLTVILVGIPIMAVGVLVRSYAARAPLTSVATTIPPGSPHEPIAALTRRELEVARLAASAYTAAEIGHQLHIGERTVESHLASTYSKLGITSRSELIRMAPKLN